MTETVVFSLLTVILVAWGIGMPFVILVESGENITNDVAGLSDVEDSGLSFADFTVSMIKAFFWFYGDLNIFGNAVKIMVNFIWAYLLIRLIRGGG